MAKQVLPHTAIPTWSGFIYQGRVALYYILNQLNEKNENDINELVIQIDSIEDFAILKSAANGGYTQISMHQVKAVKSTLYSTYKSDFKQLEQKWTAIGLPTVEAFFHLATQNEKTKAQIEALHPKLKIYEYENNAEYCSLEDIELKIREQIVLILQKYDIVGYNNSDNVQLISEILENIISDKVIYIHSLNHTGTPIKRAAYDNPIPLQNFLNIIKTDIAAQVQDEIYFENLIRRNLNRYYREFCIECEENQLNIDVKTKMDTYLLLFNSYNTNDFKKFLQNIRPHTGISYENIQQYTDLSLNNDEMKDSFYQILLNIKESNGSYGIGWVCSENKQYFPTCITYSNSDTSKKRVSERIINTALSKMVDVPFNSDYLITSECNVDNIETYANNISHVNHVDTGEAENETKITQWKKVSLIDLETAKTKLND
ncbi:ABC-three component system protein [uncultured Chryseobacterium sp.]|uniref:ABC-three component system protein n=1 Tax=uncultured Chryseobacterium sp. TaxID=259322 RepID=UPI0025CF9493|nr:ABC-three component system protein [uncultured Chryseobacterium sp.]